MWTILFIRKPLNAHVVVHTWVLYLQDLVALVDHAVYDLLQLDEGQHDFNEGPLQVLSSRKVPSSIAFLPDLKVEVVFSEEITSEQAFSHDCPRVRTRTQGNSSMQNLKDHILNDDDDQKSKATYLEFLLLVLKLD